jgi:tetratricopeptide (TPR) repeat protein
MSESSCPYKNVMKKFSFFNRDNDAKEEQVVTTADTERGIEMNTQGNAKCPFGYDNPNTPNSEKIEKMEKEAQEKTSKSQPEEGKEPNKEEISDNEEEQAQGGCPVMNKTKKDPANKHYEECYEIPRFGPFDFMFHLRGMLEPEDYLEKTKKVRSFPRHMRHTLFLQNNEKLKKVHEKEFPMVFFIYDDIKEKGNRLFRRKKFRECIENYNYAYGLLKWIEFKDKKRQEEFLKKPSLDAILDEDIEEKHVYLDDVQVEEDSYKACVVYLLMNLSYAYMELRHFTEAIECMDEAIPMAEDKVPDLYFRRSQARTYNKFSTEEELQLAMEDIDKAIELKPDENIYKEHKMKLENIKKEKLVKELEKTKSKFYNLINRGNTKSKAIL